MRLLPLSIVALLAACATTPPPFAAEGSIIAISDGVHVGRLVAVPQVLLEDSRCPMNARCVWAGRVVLSTRIYGPDFDETVPLTLGEPHALHGTSITLTSAQPEKMAGEDTPVPNYRFGFEGGR
ncbi:MAG TPA: hypothetical protein VI168_05215 [Croceibacterium sp.]